VFEKLIPSGRFSSRLAKQLRREKQNRAPVQKNRKTVTVTVHLQACRKKCHHHLKAVI